MAIPLDSGTAEAWVDGESDDSGIGAKTGAFLALNSSRRSMINSSIRLSFFSNRPIRVSISSMRLSISHKRASIFLCGRALIPVDTWLVGVATFNAQSCGTCGDRWDYTPLEPSDGSHTL